MSHHAQERIWPCRAICLALGSLLLLAPATTATAVTVRTFGIDGMSCADWMASDMQMRDGRAFVLGYWAASNRANTKHPHVGANVNTEDIVIAVYQACSTHQADTLPDAAAATYRRFEREGK